MKSLKFITAAIVFFLSAFGMAQQVTSQSTSNAASGVLESDNFTVFYSIGEPNIGLLESGDVIVSLGFLATLEEVGDALSNEEIQEVDIRYYPNPVKDFLHFNLNHINESVTIKMYSLNGSLVGEMELDTYNSKVNMKHFQAGVYLVHFIQEKSEKHFKIIKK